MHRRTLLQASLAAGLPAPAFAQGAAARTLRVIPQANLTSLDPVWTTAVVTRNHAFLVYDQLCAQDAKGEIRPQMAEGWAMEPDGLAWTFTCATACASMTGRRCWPRIASPASSAGRGATPSPRCWGRTWPRSRRWTTGASASGCTGRCRCC